MWVAEPTVQEEWLTELMRLNRYYIFEISRGGFTGSFLVQCLAAMGVTNLRLDDT